MQPEVLVSYPVHGISGFHDHLITHAVVKRVFVELRESMHELRRLAFCSLTEEQAEASTVFPLSCSTAEEIDCLVQVESQDIEACRRALDCYVTFRETIERTAIKEKLYTEVPFEFFGEDLSPPVDGLFGQLP